MTTERALLQSIQEHAMDYAGTDLGNVLTAAWAALATRTQGAQAEPVRCAGCDIPNGCPEYCRCKGTAPPSDVLVQVREVLELLTEPAEDRRKARAAIAAIDALTGSPK
jgi:hypothetical protein